MLAAAPWGNPFVWGRARYVVDGCGGRRVETVSRTSLEAVIECFNADSVLVVVADTVALAPSRECEAVGGPVDPGSVQSYDVLVERARVRVEEWIRRCSDSRTLREMLDSGRLTVEVVPGLGVYGGWGFGRVECSGKGSNPIQSYGGEVFHLLLSALARVKPERLVVDLTHGVNYMPVAFREAAKLAATAYAVSEGLNVELVFTNSEPYPASVRGETPLLNVYVVGRERVEAVEAAERAAVAVNEYFRSRGGGRVRPVCVSDPEQARKGLGKLVNDAAVKVEGDVRLGVAAARILVYAMPLAAAYLAATAKGDAVSRLLGILDAVRRERNRRTVMDRDKREVRQPLLYSMDDTVFLAFTVALQEYLRRVVSSVNVDVGDVENDGVPLSKLESIAERLGAIYRAIVFNELNSVAMSCLKPGGECPFPVLLHRWPNAECDDRARSSMDTRNLRAHAGLERNIVEAKIGADDLYLRYRRSCWKHLLEVLAKPSF